MESFSGFSEYELIAHGLCHQAGCKCQTPLLGWSDHNTPRCRLCNVEVEAQALSTTERRVVAEWGFRCAERGWNLERTMEALKELQGKFDAHRSTVAIPDATDQQTPVEAPPHLAREAQAWKPIETLPSDLHETLLVFWIVPKTPEEAPCNTSGHSIFSTFTPYLMRGKYRTWSSLSKATHWRVDFDAPLMSERT